MARECVLALMILSLLAGPAKGDKKPPKADPALATLPLAEVLRLHRELDEAQGEPDPDVPVRATVNRMELTGRLLDEAVDIEASFEVTVLAQDEWVRVPLLKKDPTMVVTKLPTVAKGSLVMDGGYLCLITSVTGAHSFNVSFLKRAQAQGAQRTVEVEFQEATLADLRLRYDEGLFHLLSAMTLRDAEGAVVYPEGNRFVLRWERTSAQAVAKETRRPPIESMITAAHGSVVSTLDGRQITRVLYHLRFEGSKAIVFYIPEGLDLERVYLNGSSVPFALEGRELRLEVVPGRAGDESARVELMLSRREGGFLLSGRLDFLFPSASWSIDELFVRLHLPGVFNYAWSGGSLAEAESSPLAEFTHSLPTPGKVMLFHQYLVSSPARLEVRYTVDLAGSYFHVRP